MVYGLGSGQYSPLYTAQYTLQSPGQPLNGSAFCWSGPERVGAGQVTGAAGKAGEQVEAADNEAKVAEGGNEGARSD